MNELETIIFEIISNGGTAKSLVYEALEESYKGNYAQVENLLKEADEYLIKAHKVQTKLIQEEASGKHTEVSVLFVHAQDHLMSALEVRSLVEHLIKMNKKLNELSH